MYFRTYPKRGRCCEVVCALRAYPQLVWTLVGEIVILMVMAMESFFTEDIDDETVFP